jgi:regulator of protease activity HflC (stomatin/prohibitin superfamily)
MEEMMKDKKRLRIWIGVAAVILVLAVISYALVQCETPFFANVPPGYLGKVLTPEGWDPRILQPGQIDLGEIGEGGAGNSLILVEGVTTTVREKFQEEATNDDAGDDRVLTRDGVPLTMTVYIRLTVSEDEQARSSIFAQMTPGVAQERVSTITLQDVYNRFAKMDVRNRIRGIVASYDNYKSLYIDFDEANQKINQAIAGVFEQNHVPLLFQNAGISNAKPDQKVWDAENEKVAAQARADAMNIISAAVSADPNALITLKWQYLQKIAEASAASGTKIIIITDTENDIAAQLPAISNIP